MKAAMILGAGVLAASVGLLATAEAQQAPAGLQHQQMAGTIVSVNAKGQELVLQRSGAAEAAAPIRLAVEEGANISDGARTLRLEDLKPGQEVEVQFAEKDGKHTAHAITVKAAGTESESPATGAPEQRPGAPMGAPEQRR